MVRRQVICVPFSDFKIVTKHLLEFEDVVAGYVSLSDALLPPIDQLLPVLSGESTAHRYVAGSQHDITLHGFIFRAKHT
jgi:hypothetical protein